MNLICFPNFLTVNSSIFTSLAEFILGTSYPSLANYMSEKGNLSA